MAEKRITDLDPYVPLVSDLTTIFFGVDRDAAVDSEKVSLGNVLAVVQNVQSLGSDPTGAATANELFSYNNTTGDLFYVDSAGDWQAVPIGSGVTNLNWNAALSEVESDTGGNATISLADATNPGLLSSADFDKLSLISISLAANIDSIANETTNNTAARVPSGGNDNDILRKTSGLNYAWQWEALPVANLGYTAAATTGDVTITEGGTSATIPAATITEAGLMIATDKVKLDAMDENAQVPSGGADNYVLKKQGPEDWNYNWEAETGGSGLPALGSVGDVLINDAPGSATWEDPTDTGSPGTGAVPWAVPAGGANSDVLKKQSANDYDFAWAAGGAPGSIDLGWDKTLSRVTNTGGNFADLTVVDSTDPGLMTSAQFDTLTFITATEAIDLDRVEELALYGETAHSLVAGDVGKPVASGGVRYDDTDYYNDPLGILTVRDDANTFTIASAGDRVFIPDAVVDPTYTRATDGNFMFWDDSANTGAGYWKPEPELDAALNSRELIMMVRDAGSEWEAVVL